MFNLLDLGLLPAAAAASGVASRLPRVLVLGDADFAYAHALARRLGSAAAITATAFEDEDSLLVRYPHAASTMEALRSMGTTVRCGVDARRLETLAAEEAASVAMPMQWERVVFNLPQSPAEPKARNQIQRHRTLLRELCVSCAAHLAPHGELWITLLSGQGGTPLDPIQRSSPGDTWQLQEQAACAGLLVRAVESIDLGALEAAGYSPTGRRANQPLGVRRKAKGLVLHVMTAARPADGEDAPRSVAPLEWTLDNSFWLGGGGATASASAPTEEEEPDPAELLERCRDALGSLGAHALAAEPSLIDKYTEPSSGRRARTFRFIYRSSVLPLCRERALVLNAQVCAALACGGAARLETRIPSQEAIERLSGDEGEEGAEAATTGDRT
jgi:hypothetical protein